MLIIERIFPDRPYNAAQIIRLIDQLAEDRNAPRQPITPADVHEIISNPNYHLYVASDGSSYVGMVSLIFQRDFGRWISGIYNLFVLKDYRNQGVADMILKAVHVAMKTFANREGYGIHTYFTTQSPYILSTRFQQEFQCVLVAQAVGPTGTNLCKMITRPQDS